MKELYSFTVERKVGKKKEKTKVGLLKPKPSTLEDAEFYYSSEFNKFVNAGLLTRAMMNKKMGDIGGITSQVDLEELTSTLVSMADARKTIEFYGGSKDLTEEQQEALQEAEVTFQQCELHLTNHQMAVNAQYAQTADNKAQERLIRWLVLNHAVVYDQIGDKEEYFDLFEGGNYKEKEQFYKIMLDEEFDEEDKDLVKKKEIIDLSMDRLLKAISIWYNNLGEDTKSIDAKIKEIFGED